MSGVDVEQADLFRALFETAPDAMIVVDGKGSIVLANAQAGRLFGYARGDLQGLTVEALLPEGLRAAHGKHRQRFMANPRVRPMGAGFELVGMRRDGSEFPVEIGLSPVRAGEHPLYAASIRDISETQRARLALARARYDSFVGQVGRLALESPDYEALLVQLPKLVAEALAVDASAIFLSGTQHRDLHARGSAGIPLELLERLPVLLRRVDWQSHATTHRSAQALQDLGERDADELRGLLAEAGFRDAALLPLFDRREAVGILLALAREGRAFDHDKLFFLQSAGHLLTAAMQRNRGEERLAHAQRLEAIGQLTGGVAHDFNNLLTVISGNLQLLEDERDMGEKQAPIIQSALRAVRSGAALTRKLLAFARRQRLSPRPIAPAAWLTEVSVLLKRTLGETVVVHAECAQSLPNVFADPGELDAALVNLALNSRDAMPRGGELSISVDEHHLPREEPALELAPGRYISISVADTGIGMAPDVLAHSMEPFFTTKEAGKGSGLGLSMVYGFAKQSGGAMRIESQLGYGTRAVLYLPVAPGHAAEEEAPELPVAAREGETVLVVEDEADVRDVVVAFLRSLGYASRVAATADEALALLRVEPKIELLFSDVALGGVVTGVDLAREALRLRPSLRVLLTSGYEHPRLDGDGNRFELLRKPYSREEFAEALRRMLARN
ncbi:PAS domain S-box protein [Dokdonella sp.]|uniref:PAS domain S-box protein n=1 Tax=Dokdonella sp. TaxID=2291710 RepID=UPI00260B64E3|nr:PAS domain S-box protein [Dokdonella sp.]